MLRDYLWHLRKSPDWLYDYPCEAAGGIVYGARDWPSYSCMFVPGLGFSPLQNTETRKSHNQGAMSDEAYAKQQSWLRNQKERSDQEWRERKSNIEDYCQKMTEKTGIKHYWWEY